MKTIFSQFFFFWPSSPPSPSESVTAIRACQQKPFRCYTRTMPMQSYWCFTSVQHWLRQRNHSPCSLERETNSPWREMLTLTRNCVNRRACAPGIAGLNGPGFGRPADFTQKERKLCVTIIFWRFGAVLLKILGKIQYMSAGGGHLGLRPEQPPLPYWILKEAAWAWGLDGPLPILGKTSLKIQHVCQGGRSRRGGGPFRPLTPEGMLELVTVSIEETRTRKAVLLGVFARRARYSWEFQLTSPAWQMQAQRDLTGLDDLGHVVARRAC